MEENLSQPGASEETQGEIKMGVRSYVPDWDRLDEWIRSKYTNPRDEAVMISVSNLIVAEVLMNIGKADFEAALWRIDKKEGRPAISDPVQVDALECAIECCEAILSHEMAPVNAPRIQLAVFRMKNMLEGSL